MLFRSELSILAKQEPGPRGHRQWQDAVNRAVDAVAGLCRSAPRGGIDLGHRRSRVECHARPRRSGRVLVTHECPDVCATVLAQLDCTRLYLASWFTRRCVMARGVDGFALRRTLQRHLHRGRASTRRHERGGPGVTSPRTTGRARATPRRRCGSSVGRRTATYALSTTPFSPAPPAVRAPPSRSSRRGRLSRGRRARPRRSEEPGGRAQGPSRQARPDAGGRPEGDLAAAIGQGRVQSALGWRIAHEGTDRPRSEEW